MNPSDPARCPACRALARRTTTDPRTGEVVSAADVLDPSDLAEYHREHS